MGPRGGLDLGGTKVQAVVYDVAAEQVLGQARRPTPSSGGPPAVVEALLEAMTEAAEQAGVATGDLSGVGVGGPGDVDARAGTLAHAGNLPDWDAPFALGPALAQRLGTAVTLGNDVNVATLAEFELGAGRQARSLLGVFWGTGVGGGIVLDGELWSGRGGAGELGHVVVKMGGALCPCGRRGCLEAYAGRRAMEQRARRLVEKGRTTALFHIMRERGRETLTSGVWERALDQGDEVAERIFARALAALGAGVASAINLLDLETVVVGGGLGVRFGQPMADRIAEAMQPHLFADDRPPQVKVAALGDLGGAIGAVLLSERESAQLARAGA